MVKKVRNSTTKNISKVEAVSVTDKEVFWRRIMIIDDDSDTTLTFKEAIVNSNNADERRIQVQTYNDPLIALSEFKPNLYDLLLIDINLPNMNGFELGQKILEIDINVRVCFMSSGEINREALGEIYPALSLGCFIRKPAAIDYLVKRIRSELD